jgi:hypothetical protein
MGSPDFAGDFRHKSSLQRLLNILLPVVFSNSGMSLKRPGIGKAN